MLAKCFFRFCSTITNTHRPTPRHTNNCAINYLIIRPLSYNNYSSWFHGRKLIRTVWGDQRRPLPTRSYAQNSDIKLKINPAIEKLVSQLVAKHKEAETLLNTTGLDVEEVKRLAIEYKSTATAAALAERFEKKKTERKQLEAMIKENSDKELTQIAKEDLQSVQAELEQIEKDLVVAMLPQDVADDRNAILEVRAGTGGREAQLFAAEMFEMYKQYAKTKGWSFEVLEYSSTEIGGCRDATAIVSGNAVFGLLRFESGVHRVQRNPITEKTGKTHTSTITIAILPEAEEVDVKLNDRDLRIDVYRAGGAGGQHVNKTESAVRITHIPTGISVAIQDDRSQHRNKSKALQILRSRLFEKERERQAETRAAARREQIGSAERSDRIRTYNFQQGRITDHRSNTNKHDLGRMMAGELLDEFITDLRQWHQSEQLKELIQENQ